jgi:hypothetical protein
MLISQIPPIRQSFNGSLNPIFWDAQQNQKPHMGVLIYHIGLMKRNTLDYWIIFLFSANKLQQESRNYLTYLRDFFSDVIECSVGEI